MKQTQMLISEAPIILLPKLASVIGLNEAIVLQQIHYWLLKSKHIRDNKIWVYNSIEEWSVQFPFISRITLRRTFSYLRRQGIVDTANYNKKKYDRTIWYTINYNRLEELGSNCSLRVNPIAQIEQMDKIKMAKPIPEITKENAEEVYNESAHEDINDKNIKKELKEVIQVWNTEIPCQKENINATHIIAFKLVLARNRSKDLVVQAIMRYGAILRDPERYFFNYRWNLEEFMKKNNALDKFSDDSCYKKLQKEGKNEQGKSAKNSVRERASFTCTQNEIRRLEGIKESLDLRDRERSECT